MTENDGLATRFEEHRAHLRGVAYRMLGSLSEAEDAVQESWLRASRADTSGVENLGGWLTTVVARVCLDLLRSREARREELHGAQLPEPLVEREGGVDPEQEALLADQVGLALLVVLDTLNPAERIAFVLHDLFAVPFEEVASIVGRTPEAARQLASRARRRVQGAAAVPEAELTRQRDVVGAFLAALRAGDLDALLAVLDPEVVVQGDRAALPPGTPAELRGAGTVATQILKLARGARAARPALVEGRVGVVVAPGARLLRVLRFTLTDGKIARIDVVAEPAGLRQLDLAVLDAPHA
ncbi:RNA polymerase sigma factor SigJ [Pyxidicoccus fallax]|uniref:RNA polymerase sigma factor SigJ n=1 Tax=Pyxidicoccus fallax TaxID=394095 RepID=A0A848L7X6_9BACT|nr:RNA polymerase sigma factor SigJ [Pyxidicoccus fallax]NMO14666.1 RNA polymerase sigma factor SigJ [Pyxidicoccus fallax]NPC78457.1 RNA polymerase sigma factor SigJ [Pyxidicoccus fallax]